VHGGFDPSRFQSPLRAVHGSKARGVAAYQAGDFSGDAAISTMYRYALRSIRPSGNSTAKPRLVLPGNTTIPARPCYSFNDKGKKQQWDAAERIDWSFDLDPENPMMLDDRVIPIFGAEV
jgi:hypothetical protein